MHKVLKTIPETVPTQVGQAPLSVLLLAVLSVLPDVRELRNWEGPMATSPCSHSASAATRWDNFLLHSFSWLILSYLVLGSSESLFPRKTTQMSFYTELDSPMLRGSISSRMLLVSILWFPWSRCRHGPDSVGPEAYIVLRFSLKKNKHEITNRKINMEVNFEIVNHYIVQLTYIILQSNHTSIKKRNKRNLTFEKKSMDVFKMRNCNL